MWQRFSYLLNQTNYRAPSVPLDTRLIGPRVILRAGDPADWKSWRAMRELSRDFLVPWEPEWPRNGLSYSFFCGLLRKHWRDWRMGKSFALMIFLQDDFGKPGALIGSITLSDVQRGIAQTGTLGYWIGKPHAGCGYMTEAAGLVCDFAFNALRLHRIEANCMPANERSINLLRKLAFEQEGYAKAYLQINGAWEDHLLWGRVNPRHLIY
jgi:ribosomal-protein-alanine N-acetyltransferase